MICYNINIPNVKGKVKKMPDNSRAINRVFTRGVISGLLRDGTNEIYDYVVKRYVNEPENKTHGDIISEIYACLGKEKRNEYYYTNTLLNNLLVEKHDVSNTAVLSQVHIGNSVADFVMINGAGNIYVYEVKSELDNFDRLADQLRDYYKAFSKVSVLTSERELYKIKQILSSLGDMGQAVGICVLSSQDTISKEYGKEPEDFNDYLDYNCIFKLLRKREYENVLEIQFGEIPQVEPVFHFKACLEAFRQIPIDIAQDLTFKELKKRNKITKTEFANIKTELKAVVYFSELSKNIKALERLLQSNYRR